MDSAPSLGGPVAARKVVTALFCDVAGSTALGELLDAEVLQSVLSRYFGLAAAVIERHGGTVEKFIGDAVMAVFGVPVLHEDDAVRACRAAHELLSELPRLNDELERDFGTRLELRVGVNSGEVAAVAGQLLATGDAVNVAARLEQAAEPGQILIGPATLALARDAVTVEALEPLELKGKGSPVQAYRLIAVEPGRPRSPSGLDVPMVGRAEEKERLEGAFRDVVALRACRLVTVLGTAGVGKSRLTAEFLSGIDATVVRGHCLSYGEGITYWPVVEVVKQLGNVGELLTTQSPHVAAAFRALMGEGSAATPGEIAWAVRRLFEKAAAERPLVVVFDDIHWAEPTFLDLIDHVADLSHDASILIVCLARAELLEHRPAWSGRRPDATTLLLQPLDPGETGELIDRLINPGELDAELVARIGAASAGNPLFVEEMVAMARDSEGGEVAVPPTIKALLAARIDQLDPSERGVLERGAVEGELFHRGAVEALVASPEPVLQQLVALVRKELVRPDRPTLPAEDAYRFRHLLIRDAAYDALPKAARASLHERFADWLEQQGTDLVERDEIIGYHLEQAYRYRRELGPAGAEVQALAAHASDLLGRAGRRARSRADHGAAVTLFRRAAELDPGVRLGLLVELGEVLFETGQLTEASVVLDEAITSARECGNEVMEAVAAVWRAIASGHQGDDPTGIGNVLVLTQRVVGLLERAGDDPWLVSMLLVDGRHRLYLGEFGNAQLALERARGLALAIGDTYRAQQCLVSMLVALWYGPTPLSSATAFVAHVASEPGSGILRAPVALCYIARMTAASGDLAGARAGYAEALHLADELGLGAIRRFSLYNAGGEVELMAGKPDLAERELRLGFDGLGELGETGYRASIAARLAAALAEQGRDDEADAVLRAVEGSVELDDVHPQVLLRVVRARLLVRRSELSAAEAAARKAIEVVSATDMVLLHGEALVALAEVQRAFGALKESTETLRHALDLFKRKESVVQAEQTRLLLNDLEKQLDGEKS